MSGEAFEPTAEQRAAIEVAGSAAVRAGAGSGKTAVLARRFVHLLRPGPGEAAAVVAEVNQILAITFTEKAAGEMKRKIREVVAAALAAASSATRGHWERVQRDLLGAQISTIHAFAARVLRENPLEAAIDPRSTVLDEHESSAFVEATIEAALLARLRAGDPAAADLILRSGLAGGRTGGAVGQLADLLAQLARTGRDPTWLALASARQQAYVPEAAVGIARAAARVVRAIDARLAAGSRAQLVRAFADEWPRWRAFLERLDAETPAAEFLTLTALCRRLAQARLASEVKSDLRLQDGRLRGTLAEEYGVIAALAGNLRLAELLAHVRDAVQARKREEGVLTFDDLIGETHTLFATHAAICERYARRFRAILVDEFQDTDRVQADVIRLLARSVPAPLLFIVGDEKQSIYRFRGADVSVFQELRSELGRELPLGTNFRSLPSILDFVNTLAGSVFRVPEGGDPSIWTRFDASQRLVADRTEDVPGGGVRLVTFVAQHRERDLSAAEARELEARVVAAVVARLHAEDGISYGSIAVLFRAFTEVKTYENALRRAEIPYYAVKGRGFFQCQEVTDVMSLLGAVLDGQDEVALAAALRSPFFAFDDDVLVRLAWPTDAVRPQLARRFRRAETFADVPGAAAALTRARDLLLRLRRLRSRATIAELIEEAFAATDYEAVCLTQFQGTQKVANARKLIELAREWERRRFLTLREFVSTVRRLAASEPREPEAALAGEEDDVVRLMTVHQAKGLEFDAVILPDLGRRVRPEYRAIALSDDFGLVAGLADETGGVVLDHAELERHRAREVDRERAEQARLLYVACTRAKDVLVLLEGKGEDAYLRDGRGDATSWCHQVWDVIGRERVAAFIDRGTAQETLGLPMGGAIRIERADEYLAGSGTEPPFPEPQVAAAGAVEHDAVEAVLGFRPPAPVELETSPTAIADFRRCPRQYWYRHVLGLPEPGTGGVRAALLGTAAHAVLEAVDLAAPAEEEVARRLSARPELLGLRTADVDALGADLRLAVAALGRDVAGGLTIVGREVPFVLPLPAAAPRLFLHGRLDLLARRGPALVVRDYKYARPSAAAAVNYGAQLAAYVLAVRATGVDTVEAELVFLRGGTVVERLPPLDAAREEEAFVSAGRALAEALGSGGVDAFPRGPSAPEVCRRLGCGHVSRCWGVTRRAGDPPSDSAAV
jgi:ATP-dependent helicase/nuclease subunit A